ncbi:NAD(P)-dependent alcohol dehydrogenase [Lunatibacter salilacus]|uniref:NAD(P)-dependent alcohol dehydrogenase n=1 Tax=Lunatibacter salilacus TaxID=2483804 RepID=UPI00131D690E|nr:NAD(P)-dependent alcohol dehydrogenase [Lunatibacter salilacus]
MQAALRYHYGSPDRILVTDYPKPVPKEYEILIKIKATTVNRTDCGVLSGSPYIFRFFVGWPHPRTPILGTDFAGVAEEVGKKVTKFKVGDKVWGFDDNGLPSQAEFMAYREDANLMLIPEGISFKEAAASAEAAHYAINFIKKVTFTPTSRVLVNGATGGIGSAAVQILLHEGREVTATAHSKHVQMIKELGVKKVIPYDKEDFTKTTDRFDIVLDAVGKSTFEKCKPILNEKGVYLSSELGDGIENLYLPLTTSIRGGKRVIFPLPTDIKASLAYIQRLLIAGSFRPVLDRSYPLEKAMEAYTYVAAGKKIGNVILDLENGKEEVFIPS